MIKLTKSQSLFYKKRWKRVTLREDQELKESSISSRFKQLCFLMNSFRVRPTDQQEKEMSRIRRRWGVLRKRSENARS